MNSLFEKWKARPNHSDELFITDGIMNKEKWGKAKIKILFVLKEAYDSDRLARESWDLPLKITSEPVSSKMWKSLAQWTYGLKKLFETGDVYPYVKEGPELNECLFSAAVVNIKKSAGTSKSSHNDLLKYLEDDWDLLEQQINEINPDIIICGSTWHLIHTKLNEAKSVSDMIYKTPDNRLYVDMYHPANKYSYKLNYYYLCALVSQSRLLEKLP